MRRRHPVHKASAYKVPLEVQCAGRRSAQLQDAGKGAAIGAVAGTMAGGARQRRKGQAEAQQQQQIQQQSQQPLAGYNRAFGACMEGRGYTIK